MAKILVVEDDVFFRDSILAYLREHRHDVSVAPDGRVARDMCGLQEFNLVISDIRMPFLDGVELLRWIKANRPTPFIIMTGFTNLLEAKAAYEMGADKFLPKPFKNGELLDLIKSITDPKEETAEPIENQQNKYCRISMDEFVSKPKIDFPIFIKLGQSKYVKIGHTGEQIPTERIDLYKAKGLKHLHILKEDFNKLVDFNLVLLKAVVASDDVDHQKKLNFMKYTTEAILEKAFVDNVDKELFDDAKDVLTTTIGAISESGEYYNLLDNLSQHSDWVYAHSVATSMFSIMIARKLGHASSQTFFKLGMAGLFHEIGYKELPRELLEKPRPLLNHSEKALLESHVNRSYEILGTMKGIPNDILEIVYQHHEDLTGHGYPRRIQKNQFHPLTKIFQVADLFADQAIKGPHHQGMTGAAAVNHVQKFYGDRIDSASLSALASIFNMRLTG